MQCSVDRLVVAAAAGRLSIALKGDGLFDLPLRVAVDVDGQPDVDCFEPQGREEHGRGVWTVRSSNWERKELSLSVEGPAVVLRVRLYGKGRPGKVRFFVAGDSRPGIRYEVLRYLVPAGLFAPQSLPQIRNTMESASIELGYMTPPLLAFPFTGRFAGSCAVGLGPQPGAYNLDHFRCEFAAPQSGLFSTDFQGYTVVDGELELPALTFTTGPDEFAALGAYVDWLYAHGGCRRVERGNVPRWWLGPFFCGWGEQACVSPADIQAGANQTAYTGMSERMDALGLQPAAVIIDDKWQSQYGTMCPDPDKWPDLRAFVDAQHAGGRKVLLWLKTWDAEGLPAEECIKCLCTPYGADPTSPAYRRRVADAVRRLLSPEPGCFDCDGFKIDFANCMPLGPDLAAHEPGVYGIELLKRMLTLLYDAAKAVKPDCLINNSCCHPYFAEVTDQCRLHDVPGQLRCLWEVREFRARLFRTAFPGISVDTDDEGSTSRGQTLDYLRRAPTLGVPDLYRLHGSRDLPLTDDDFREVARIWARYSGNLAGSGRGPEHRILENLRGTPQARLSSEEPFPRSPWNRHEAKTDISEEAAPR